MMMAWLQRLWQKLYFLFKSLFFLQYLPQSLVYSYQRDSFDRRYRSPTHPQTTLPPGKLLQVSAIDQGATFAFEQAELEIRFLTQDFVRVQWLPGILPIPYAIVKQEWEQISVTLTQQETGWTIVSDALRITVSLAGQLTIVDGNGQPIRTESPPQRQGDRWRHQALLRSDEHLYGLGERATTLNLRAAPLYQEQTTPITYTLWNSDPGGHYAPGTDPLYIGIPVYLSLSEVGSYLIFYENSFRAQLTLDDSATAEFAGGTLRYYVAIGTPPQLLDRYTRLTGRPLLPPQWALGYHQSRWGYRTEAVVRQEIKAFQDHDLPLSAIHLDIDCQVAHRAFTLDPQRFPQVSAFTQELARSGVKLICINNPGIRHSRQSNLFLEGQILNAFCTYPTGELVVAPVWAGCTVFPDFTNPKVRAWWSRQYAYLLDVGVAGFWHDMNEPAAFTSWGELTLPDTAQHALEGRGGTHQEAHNLYALLQAQAAYESLQQYRPQQRPFIVSRSGWAGLQRYAWTWTGDTICTWAALRQTIATVIGLGLSGIAYSGPDIGGFQGNPTAELYLRWFQMATFLPFYRTHSSMSVLPRTPWSYGEPYLSIIRNFLHWRYQLMPYLYTLAWSATQKGCPLVRPLFWENWRDRSLWQIDDAFFLGEALLVCPIVEEGARSRSITLPEGHWYNVWTDAIIKGGQTIELAAPLHQIPLLVKAGSILPMREEQQLVLHLYPPVSDEQESVLYSDAGDGHGASRLDRFYFSRQANTLALRWEQQGDYEFPDDRLLLHLHGVAIAQAWIDEQEVTVPEQVFSCTVFHHLRFVIDN